MSINQNIRYAETGPYYNPEALYDIVKPSRILINNINPISGPNDAENNDKNYWINTTTGDFFENIKGNWYLVYNFSTGGTGGDINTIQNIGTGKGLFKDITGSTANFKTILGAATQLTITDAGDEIRMSMNENYKPLTLSRVSNFYISGDTFPPNGTIGEAQGANVGSIWVQLPNTIWICQNPTTRIWNLLTTSNGIQSNINLGFGGGKVYKETDPAGVASFRTVAGTVDQVNVSQNDNDVILSMNTNYKPVSLSKVSNVLNNYDGTQPAPTVNNDSSQGYQIGSVWSSGSNLYICQNASIGAAVWTLINNISSIQNDLYMVRTNTGLQATTFPGVLVYTKLNVGNSFIESNIRGSWSNGTTGSGAVITRIAPSNGLANNKYLINYNLTVFRSVAAVPSTRLYDVEFAEGDGSDPGTGKILASESILIYQPNTEYAYCSGSFIFSTSSTSPVSIFPIIRSNNSTAAIFANYMTITITEI